MPRLSIKTYMIFFLMLLAVVGIYQQKEFIILSAQLVITVLTAVILDLAINYFKSKKIILPSSAIITGLIVGMVMARGEPYIYYVLASFLAIFSKHIFKINNRHIFNPANFGLLAINIFLGAYIGWYPINAWFVIIPGMFIALKIKRLHIILSYLLTFAILLMFYGHLKGVGIFSYFAVINSFFVVVMLIEPKTSPIKLCRGIVFGCFTAVIGFLCYLIIPRFDYLLVSLACGNLMNAVTERIKRC